MFNQINQVFDFNQKALNIYVKRQEILASNIANADTPGYKAVDINFKDELNKTLNKKDTKIILKKTSPNHLNGKNNHISLLKIIPVISNNIKPDGNTVNMDRERIEFVNNSLKYVSTLAFIKNEIKNIIHVLQG
ncbi:flagellar basal body rod protein FlgB [Buchnera aphidicola]|uniref:Flagellar basal body rod protein FlgB n=1 Tax=Buchnera aphidicola str. USDA (Myzus persicae) TaxID=1009856 RepID=W0P3V6_BUCMP|nr:flagellar basal body rod protein FlgB [Buchnera aphidicola]AHG60050.1 Flgb [Buchnera aphidicola str. USDA (Myzus persicae)]AHG60630.1 Flgb [Buchnera aphidicola str. W106 (Myzus persicae)]AHG61202.1 Flgb [Buchnera aphidicola str. G002 (Myzus persicae)]AHG61775.1 Flgb [Buchnera aphidicola str. F009 (Myzus persicae)]WAI03265.1 MAG: flagellar basal body rod protein FlgB [Buchnera aphidicola (Myzus persicae)]